jgi:hypothetical protein
MTALALLRLVPICCLLCVGAWAGSGSAAGLAGMPSRPSVEVSLERAPRALLRGCSTAARRLKVAIYCPTRVPGHWTVAHVCAGCNGTFSATGWFPTPAAYVGQPGEHTGHFTVWAARPRKVREGFVGCPNGKRARPTRVAGRNAAWVTCPSGSTLDGGHVLLQWSRHGWLYAISLHADTSLNRNLLRRIATTITIVKS